MGRWALLTTGPLSVAGLWCCQIKGPLSSSSDRFQCRSRKKKCRFPKEPLDVTLLNQSKYLFAFRHLVFLHMAFSSFFLDFVYFLKPLFFPFRIFLHTIATTPHYILSSVYRSLIIFIQNEWLLKKKKFGEEEDWWKMNEI